MSTWATDEHHLETAPAGGTVGGTTHEATSATTTDVTNGTIHDATGTIHDATGDATDERHAQARPNARRAATETIRLRWGTGMSPLSSRDQVPGADWCRWDGWRCPTCDRTVARRPGPGRQRVYCTNACRQRAYRWRRDRLGPDHGPRPVERATTRSLHHAVRRADDPVGDTHDDGRRVTACGTFARRASDAPAVHGHVRLLPVADGHSPRRACARCVALGGLRWYSGAEATELAAHHRAEHARARDLARARHRRRLALLHRFRADDRPPLP